MLQSDERFTGTIHVRGAREEILSRINLYLTET